MDAIRARFIAGRGDDAALIGTPADNYGLAAKVGTVEELDGDEESIHVHMEDGGVQRSFALFSG